MKNTFQKEISTPAQWLFVGGILLLFNFFFWGGVRMGGGEVRMDGWGKGRMGWSRGGGNDIG